MKTVMVINSKGGSGKTTIIRLLCRLYEPQKGQILIDDINIKDINIQCLRDQIGSVPQDVFLFSDTISNNINFGFKLIRNHFNILLKLFEILFLLMLLISHY